MTDVLQVAAAVLAKASAVDPTMPTPNAMTMHAWAEHLAGVEMWEALDAVLEHYRCSRQRIMPADLIAHIRAARQDADLRARVPALPVATDPLAAARHRAIVRAVLGAPNREAREISRALAIPCPWEPCHASAGSPCMTAGKRRATPHPSRTDAARSAA